jgi:ribose-phosphate pyrophosphokinase
MDKNSQITILGGRKAQAFEESVIDYLKNKKRLEVKKVDFDVSNFRNGELNIKLMGSVRGCNSIIFQQFTQPGDTMHEELFELFLLEDTISRSAAKSLILCLPFIPYLRQDRKAEGREPISARTLFDLLGTAAAGKLVRIVTFDMHNSAEQGFVNFPIDNLPAQPLFANYFVKQKWFNPRTTTVLAPDVGGAKRAEEFATTIGLFDGIAIMHKKRKKGQMAEAKTIIGDIEGKDVIIIDDIIDSGGTILASVEMLKKSGAKSINVAATHGIFSGDAVKNFAASGINVVTTDSIPRDKDFAKNNKWLTVLSIAGYTAEVLYENEIGGSVSKIIKEKSKIS